MYPTSPRPSDYRTNAVASSSGGVQLPSSSSSTTSSGPPRSPVGSSSRTVLEDFSTRQGGRQGALPAFSDLLRSPGGNMSKRKSRDSYGDSDRFIPMRDGSDLHANYHLFGEGHGQPGPTTPTKIKKRTLPGETDAQKEETNRTFSTLLKSELLSHTHTSPSQTASSLASSSIPSSPSRSSSNTSSSTHFSASPSHNPLTAPTTPSRVRQQGFPTSPSSSKSHHSHSSSFPTPTTPTRRRLFSYASPASANHQSGYGGPTDLDDPTHEAYSLSPVTSESQKILLSPRKPPRTVSKGPFKVLDAPDLADDYYLNLVDWSSTNVLGVGLAGCVYLWSANTSRVTKLCDLTASPGSSSSGDVVTSLNWTAKGNTVAVGTDNGEVQIWDAERCKKIRTMTGHTGRVGCLAWNENVLSSGSRDRHIYHRDVRAPEQHFRKLTSHRQEVCGLKWNTTENQLASGGNDNKLIVWNGTDNTEPLWRFGDHTAAVKAIAWSPHQRGILASGGGTADKKIRFWNTLTGTMLSATDTGSQVCNLMWSKTSNEIVSTHGYSAVGPIQNQVCIWKYPSMNQVATLSGHTFRVLYLAMSPDGQTICTGAGDETLRFWNAFQKAREVRKSESSTLNPFYGKIR